MTLLVQEAVGATELKARAEAARAAGEAFDRATAAEAAVSEQDIEEIFMSVNALAFCLTQCFHSSTSILFLVHNSIDRFLSFCFSKRKRKSSYPLVLLPFA